MKRIDIIFYIISGLHNVKICVKISGEYKKFFDKSVRKLYKARITIMLLDIFTKIKRNRNDYIFLS